MAYYRVGEILRRARSRSGMSQEELADGICSVETLSRMENGKHRVKTATYERLMEKMGAPAGRYVEEETDVFRF